MKFLVILAVAVACAAADVAHLAYSADYQAPIVKSIYEISPEGQSFNYGYETGNGIKSKVTGFVKDPNSEYPALEIKGGYRYIAPDGTPILTTFIANENGFVAQGDHIPVAPPVPEAILRSLAWIEKNKPYVEPSKPYVEPSKPYVEPSKPYRS